MSLCLLCSYFCSTASAPLLGTDHYTTFERIRLPHSPSTKASLSSTTTPSSSKSSSTKVPSSMAKPHPITPPSLVSDPNSKMPVYVYSSPFPTPRFPLPPFLITYSRPTQAHSLIYHNELARLLEVPFSDHDRLARLEAEADFAEISSENIFAVRKRYRYCLMSMRGKIEHQVCEGRIGLYWFFLVILLHSLYFFYISFLSNIYHSSMKRDTMVVPHAFTRSSRLHLCPIPMMGNSLLLSLSLSCALLRRLLCSCISSIFICLLSFFNYQLTLLVGLISVQNALKFNLLSHVWTVLLACLLAKDSRQH